MSYMSAHLSEAQAYPVLQSTMHGADMDTPDSDDDDDDGKRLSMMM
jgi:hypothetical protein